MGLVMTKSNSYIIHPVESGGGEKSPHVMFNANDWSLINGTKERIDSKYIILYVANYEIYLAVFYSEGQQHASL